MQPNGKWYTEPPDWTVAQQPSPQLKLHLVEQARQQAAQRLYFVLGCICGSSWGLALAGFVALYFAR
jgi:hypothetical protein